MKTIREYIDLIETAQNPVTEDQATRTCPQCDGSGEDALDPTKSCRRCGGKGHVPVPKEPGVAEGSDKECPPATQDIKLNLKNRQKAIDEYGYGPLNPDMPNRKFWMAKVDEWNLDSAEEAKQSLCGNCAAFDQRKHTLDCIAQGIDSNSPNDAEGVIDAGDLGYCKFLKFKCASRRTCDAWVTGGPLTDKQGVAEGIGKKDLLARLQKDLPRVDDPKNKDAEPVKWTGPKKGDYGYTGYQGHGMPTDRAERARIRADKKKQQDK
jgi:hypothetical protein